MKNGRIHANQITASSMWDRNHGPGNARLHWRRTRARTGAWSARHNNHYQWLLVDFKRPMRVVKIAIQGRQDARQWVTRFFVAYSQDCAHFAEYKENSNRKVCILTYQITAITTTVYLRYFKLISQKQKLSMNFLKFSLFFTKHCFEKKNAIKMTRRRARLRDKRGQS